MSRPTVFLDRDGVLNAVRIENGTPRPPAIAADLQLLPGVVEACGRLREAGLALVCVTNQPDIARGSTDRASVDAINRELQRRLKLADVRVCPHDDDDDCDCRKPRPGLLTAAADELDLDLSKSVMVGDRWRDIAAGRAAGVPTVFVDHSYSERAPVAPDLTVSNLKEATGWIIEKLA